MKNPIVLSLFCSVLLLSQTAHSQTLTYNQGSNQSWEGTNAWLDGAVASDWVEGSSAIFNTNTGSTFEVILSTDHTLSALRNTGTDRVDLSTSSGDALLTFSGGTIETNSVFRLDNNVNITGDFTKTGSAELFLNDNLAATSHSGTITIDAGTVRVNRAAVVSTGTHVVVNSGGTFLVGQNAGSLSMGSVNLNTGGEVLIGINNASPSLTITELSGQSGSSIGTNASGTDQDRGFTINQATDTTFAGDIVGNAGSNDTVFTKSGSGALTLDGSFGATGADFRTTSTVSDGALYLNSATNNIGDGTAGTAIEVTGGILGGSGTLTATGDDVVVNGTGQLAAGTDGSAGQLTLSLTSGQLDLTGIGNGSLLFDLGADGIAGTDYDQILLSAGSLALSNLEFDDFTFNTLAGFGAGNTYTLFSSTSLSGTLGGNTSGLIDGLSSTLSLNGNDVVLSVVPEPNAGLLLLTGLFLLGMTVFPRRRA